MLDKTLFDIVLFVSSGKRGIAPGHQHDDRHVQYSAKAAPTTPKLSVDIAPKSTNRSATLNSTVEEKPK